MEGCKRLGWAIPHDLGPHEERFQGILLKDDGPKPDQVHGCSLHHGSYAMDVPPLKSGKIGFDTSANRNGSGICVPLETWRFDCWKFGFFLDKHGNFNGPGTSATNMVEWCPGSRGSRVVDESCWKLQVLLGTRLQQALCTAPQAALRKLPTGPVL